MQEIKVIVFGATGLCGKHIVKQCLEQNMAVTLYQRNAESSIPESDCVIGDLFEEAKIANAIKDMDVIISSIGNRNYEDATQVVTPFVKLICKNITQHQRFIVVAGSGLMLHDYKTLRRELPGQPEFLVNQRTDHWDAYCHLAPLDINYLVICPTMMVEGEKDGNYVFKEKYFPQTEAKQVYAGNVADFIVKEIVNNNYKQSRIGIANK